MKQNYFKRVCSLLGLIIPIFIFPMQISAHEITPDCEAETISSIAPVEVTEQTEISEIDALLISLQEVEEEPAEEIPMITRSFTYTVYRDGEIIASGLTEPTYKDENVTPGKHDYCITVQYDEGESEKVCVEVEVKDFKPVSNLTGTATEDKVNLDWDGVTEKAEASTEKPTEKAVSYNVYKDGAKIGNTEDTHFVETNVANGTYTYEVEVQYADGVSPKVAVIVNVNYTSINDVEGQLPYTLRVEGKKIIAETEGTITIYDTSGRTIAQAQNRLEVQVQSGAYAVRFDSGSKRYVSKIMVK